jgi:hypothetical protein
MNIPESRRKIVVRGLRVLLVALGMASAFVLGVLFDRHTEVPNFLQPKPRVKAVVSVNANGVSVLRSQDFTLHAKEGLKTEGDKVMVSGFGGPISVFNDSLEVELDFDKDFGKAQEKQEAPASSAPTASELKPASSGGKIMASKNGTKYYFDSCSEVKRIKPENLVYFSTEADAKANGYDASSCVFKAKS